MGTTVGKSSTRTSMGDLSVLIEDDLSPEETTAAMPGRISLVICLATACVPCCNLLPVGVRRPSIYNMFIQIENRSQVRYKANLIKIFQYMSSK